MKKMLLLQGLIAAPLMIGVLLALVVGQVLGRDVQALAGSQDCHLPCWNNILPGETPFGQAETILANLGFRLSRIDEAGYIAQNGTTVCRVGLSRGRQGDAIVREVSLWFCQPVSLGDLIEALGPPQMVVPYISLMAFHNGEAVTMLHTRVCDTHLSPHNQVYFLSLAEHDFYVSLVEQPERLTWQGFVSLGHYRQLNPDKWIC